MANRRSPFTMDGWNKDWVIHGHKLVCRSCGVGQCPSLDEQPFRHADACRTSLTGARYPWKELNDILKDNLGETQRLLH